MQDLPDLSGGCLCGEVRYAANTRPFAVDYCHCKMCQRSTGSVVGAWMDFLVEQLVWQSTQQLREYCSSEFVRRGFCGACGSTLSYRDERHANYISLAVTSLDDANLVQPSYHIFTDSQLSWLQLGDNGKRYAQAQQD